MKSLISVLMLLIAMMSMPAIAETMCVRVEQVEPVMIVSTGTVQNGVCVIPKGVNDEPEKASYRQDN